MNDTNDLHTLRTLAELRHDLPEPSPLALRRARVKLMNRAAGERPERVRLFSRPSVRIGIMVATAAVAVAGIGLYGALGTPGRNGGARPSGGSSDPSTAKHARGAHPDAVHEENAAWSVNTTANGDVKLTTKSKTTKLFDVKPLTFERTLARAGVQATTRMGEVCYTNNRALQKRVLTWHDWVWTIHPEAMPAGSQIVIGYQSLDRGAMAWSVDLETAGHPLFCAPEPDPHYAPQPGLTAPN